MYARSRGNSETNTPGPSCTPSIEENKTTRCLVVGTDCSGLEAPIQALDNIGIVYQHAFSSDTDADCRKTISTNFKPVHIYNDVRTRDNNSAPDVDVYVAGFPCQPFSTAGKGEGFEDTQGRGFIFWNILDYIKKKKPRVFILENVRGLIEMQNGKLYETIMRLLNGLKIYNVYDDVLNTIDHGIPQNRERWYCVGILKEHDDRSFAFPLPLTPPLIGKFLQDDGNVDPAVPPFVQTVKDHVKGLGRDPDTTDIIVDCDFSPPLKGSFMENYSPCITRSRFKGHWITSKGRRFTLTEMLRLQGINPATFKKAVSDKALGQQIGNAMSVNVIERILIRVLRAANLTTAKHDCKIDRWESGIALQQILGTRGVWKLKHSTIAPSISMHKRVWIVDSGASFHVVSYANLTIQELRTVKRMEDPILIHTANGDVVITHSAMVSISDIEVTVKAYIVKDSPALISMSLLCREHDWTY
jgi:DNA (cytosine-5)-methyltransferase 1